MKEYKSIVEGLIFLSGEEGLSFQQIKQAVDCDSDSTLNDILDQLKQEYQDQEHGFELVEYASRYKFVTKESVYPYGQKLFESIKTPTLSQAALETLAIIAYKQPITRVEIEEIRGVNCEMMLKKLQARGLVDAKDRLDAVGKPLLYCVTDAFLDAFQLQTLAELPGLPTIAQEDELFKEDDA